MGLAAVMAAGVSVPLTVHVSLLLPMFLNTLHTTVL